MKNNVFVAFLLVFLECSASQKQPEKAVFQEKKIMVGAEKTAEYLPFLKNKKVALVVNQTSMIGQKHLADTLNSLKINVLRIFAPEHGFRGEAGAGEKVANSRDEKTGIEIISIYGKNKKPTPENLKNIEVVVFDIQDVGTRFFTFSSTLFLVMEACAEQKIPLVLLDRPNPNGHFIDGPMLENDQKSFVGMLPVPVVHGLTFGEMARMINGEKWLSGKKTTDLRVVACENYTHETFYEPPVRPSPNLQNIRAILLYPSLCFFEGTEISVGRGTETPFEIIGHPDFLSEFCFTPLPNAAAKEPFQNGKKCCGFNLNSMNINDLYAKKQIDLTWIFEFREQKKVRENFFLKNNFFDKLAGTKKLREQIEAGQTEAAIRESWQPDLEIYRKMREKYLIYEL